MGSGPVPTHADSVITSLFKVDLGSKLLDFVSHDYGRVMGGKYKVLWSFDK